MTTPSAQTSNAKFHPAALLLLIGCATLLAYLPAINGGPIWDDLRNMTQPQLSSLHGLRLIWTDPHATEQYYPLFYSAFWIEHLLWGDSFIAYHLLNILLHITSACLLAMILRHLQIPGAYLAATIFALHPVQVESVAWITEQKNVLSGAAYLAATLFYLHFDSSRKKSPYLAATLFFLLAIGTKTATATLPAALLVVLWWKRGRIELRRDVLPLIPWFVAGLCAGVVTSYVERHLVGAEGSDFPFTLVQRCLIAGRAVCFYLGKLFWPATLTFVYPRWDVDPSQRWQFIYPVAVALLLIVLWLIRRKSRAPLAAMLLFIGTLLPTLGFFNVYYFLFSFVADHFQYLASISIITLISALIATLAKRNRPLTTALTAIVLASLTLRTLLQSSLYRNDQMICRATLEANPDCWLIHNNYGYELLADHKVDEAIEHFQRVVALRPNYFPVYNNYGSGLYEKGDYAAALTQYQKSVDLEPRNPRTRYNLGLAMQHVGRLHEAIEQFNKSLELRPSYQPVENALDDCRIALAKSQRDVQQWHSETISKPDDADALFNLAKAYAAADQPDDAVATAENAMQIAQKNSDLDTSTRIYQWLTLYRAAHIVRN